MYYGPMQHRDIIKKLGGIRPLARELGHKYPSKVQGWHDRNSIPLKLVPAILKLARTMQKRLKMADFFDGAAP